MDGEISSGSNAARGASRALIFWCITTAVIWLLTVFILSDFSFVRSFENLLQVSFAGLWVAIFLILAWIIRTRENHGSSAKPWIIIGIVLISFSSLSSLMALVSSVAAGYNFLSSSFTILLGLLNDVIALIALWHFFTMLRLQPVATAQSVPMAGVRKAFTTPSVINLIVSALAAPWMLMILSIGFADAASQKMYLFFGGVIALSSLILIVHSIVMLKRKYQSSGAYFATSLVIFLIASPQTLLMVWLLYEIVVHGVPPQSMH